MSKIKIVPNLHLGSLELNKWNAFIADLGYKKFGKQYIGSYGVVSHPSDTSFDNLKVIQGSLVNKLTVKAGIAINGDVDSIINPSNAVDSITVPTDSVPRYVIIEHAYTSEEAGTISIAANGTLTGTGTLFTEVLRGQPYHAVKIKFLNSASNLQEYEVLSVSSDTVAQIQGASFTVETGLKYKVVGSFTPGQVISAGDKDPYQYDYYNIILSTSNTVTSKYQFLLARVTSDGITTSIVDQRTLNIFSIITSAALSNPTLSVNNPLIGIENIKFGTTLHPKHENLVRIGFGFRSPNGQWTATPSLFKITLNGGAGGTYGTTSSIVNSDFDGWRVYFKANNEFVNVVSTTVISPGVVELLLDDYNTLIHPTSGDIAIVPAADHIDISAENSSGNSNKSKVWEISTGYIDIFMGCGLNFITWTAFLGSKYTIANVINAGTYLNELSYDDNGNFTSTNTSSVSFGFATLLVHPRNFRDIKPNLDTKNLYTSSFNSFSGGSVNNTNYNSISGEVIWTVDANGNMFDLPLPANNAIVRDIVISGVSPTSSGAFIFVKFINSYTGCTFAKKLVNGTPGFSWNPESTLSDIVRIRENDVFLFLGNADKFNANEWRIVACYSHERFIIDNMLRRIMVLEQRPDYSAF